MLAIDNLFSRLFFFENKYYLINSANINRTVSLMMDDSEFVLLEQFMVVLFRSQQHLLLHVVIESRNLLFRGADYRLEQHEMSSCFQALFDESSLLLHIAFV